MLQNAHFDASRSADLESVQTGQKGQLRQREKREGNEGQGGGTRLLPLLLTVDSVHCSDFRFLWQRCLFRLAFCLFPPSLFPSPHSLPGSLSYAFPSTFACLQILSWRRVINKVYYNIARRLPSAAQARPNALWGGVQGEEECGPSTLGYRRLNAQALLHTVGT